ncbi:MAG: hypothetical protein ACI9W6_002791 [Motiliproteus sp.]|jgi:hypothetical protein
MPPDSEYQSAWDAFTRSSRRGANLDISAVLYDASGKQIPRSDPANDTDASLSATVPQGMYFIRGNLTSESSSLTPPVADAMESRLPFYWKVASVAPRVYNSYSKS